MISSQLTRAVLTSVVLLVQLPFVAAQSPPKPSSASSAAVVYVNSKYGFEFFIPQSWTGYTIVEDPWTDDSGAMIRIRHPLWTEADPREDIPIMIFTHQQWRRIQKGKLVVSAAPFPPGELGRNKRFVFALPPRWEYDFLDGVEEAEKILGGTPLHGFDRAPVHR